MTITAISFEILMIQDSRQCDILTHNNISEQRIVIHIKQLCTDLNNKEHCLFTCSLKGATIRSILHFTSSQHSEVTSFHRRETLEIGNMAILTCICFKPKVLQYEPPLAPLFDKRFREFFSLSTYSPTFDTYNFFYSPVLPN